MNKRKSITIKNGVKQKRISDMFQPRKRKILYDCDTSDFDDIDNPQPSTSKRAREAITTVNVSNVQQSTPKAATSQEPKTAQLILSDSSDIEDEVDRFIKAIARKKHYQAGRERKHIVAPTSESEVSDDEHLAYSPIKQSLEHLLPPNTTPQAARNTIHILYQARTYDEPIKLPVQIGIFKRFINMDVVIDQIIQILCIEYDENAAQLMQNKKWIDSTKNDFYLAFYIFPIIRERLRWKLNPRISFQMKAKLLSVPKREKLQFDEQILEYIEFEHDVPDVNEPSHTSLSLNGEDRSHLALTPQQHNNLDETLAMQLQEEELQKSESQLLRPDSEAQNHDKHNDTNASRCRHEHIDETAMPVPLETFKNWTNLNEIVQIFLRNKYKDKLGEQEKKRKHAKYIKLLEKYFYGEFYTAPLKRLKWPYKYLKITPACKDEMKSMLFEVPHDYRDDSLPACIASAADRTQLDAIMPLTKDEVLLKCMPVTFASFKKYVICKKAIAILEAYLEKALTVEEMAALKAENVKLNEHILRYFYEQYYTHEEIRNYFVIKYNPCPKKFKEKLIISPKLVRAEYEIQLNNNNSVEQLSESSHRNSLPPDISPEEIKMRLQQYLPLLENRENYKDSFPINFETFTKYFKEDDVVTEIVENLSRKITIEEFLEFTEKIDLHEHVLQYIYEQYYTNPEFSLLARVSFKPAPKRIKKRLLLKPKPDSANLQSNTSLTSGCIAAAVNSNETVTSQADTRSCAISSTQSGVILLSASKPVPDSILKEYIYKRIGDASKVEAILMEAKRQYELQALKEATHTNAIQAIAEESVTPNVVAEQSAAVNTVTATDMQNIETIYFCNVPKDREHQSILDANAAQPTVQYCLHLLFNMSFDEFCMYARIYKCETLFENVHIGNNRDVLLKFYNFAFREQKIWPVNLYMQNAHLLKFLAARNVYVKNQELLNLIPMIVQCTAAADGAGDGNTEDEIDRRQTEEFDVDEAHDTVIENTDHVNDTAAYQVVTSTQITEQDLVQNADSSADAFAMPINASPNLFSTPSDSTETANTSNFINMPNTQQQIEMLAEEQSMVAEDPLLSSVSLIPSSMPVKLLTPAEIKREKHKFKALNNLMITINDDTDEVVYETIRDEPIVIADDEECSQKSNATDYVDLLPNHAGTAAISTSTLNELAGLPSFCETFSNAQRLPSTLNELNTSKDMKLEVTPQSTPEAWPVNNNVFICIPRVSLDGADSNAEIRITCAKAKPNSNAIANTHAGAARNNKTATASGNVPINTEAFVPAATKSAAPTSCGNIQVPAAAHIDNCQATVGVSALATNYNKENAVGAPNAKPASKLATAAITQIVEKPVRITRKLTTISVANTKVFTLGSTTKSAPSSRKAPTTLASINAANTQQSTSNSATKPAITRKAPIKYYASTMQSTSTAAAQQVLVMRKTPTTATTTNAPCIQQSTDYSATQPVLVTRETPTTSATANDVTISQSTSNSAAQPVIVTRKAPTTSATTNAPCTQQSTDYSATQPVLVTRKAPTTSATTNAPCTQKSTTNSTVQTVLVSGKASTTSAVNSAVPTQGSTANTEIAARPKPIAVSTKPDNATKKSSVGFGVSKVVPQLTHKFRALTVKTVPKKANAAPIVKNAATAPTNGVRTKQIQINPTLSSTEAKNATQDNADANAKTNSASDATTDDLDLGCARTRIYQPKPRPIQSNPATNTATTITASQALATDSTFFRSSQILLAVTDPTKDRLQQPQQLSPAKLKN